MVPLYPFPKLSCITDLPVELLVETLARLDGYQILRCCLVCRTFKDVIDHYTELQYKIELFADGMIDGPPSSVSPAERLKVLLERRKAWSLLDWKKEVISPMEGACQAYELVGGVFAKSMIPGPFHNLTEIHPQFTTSWLPSSSDEGRTMQIDLDIVARDFAMDPSQDLIIFLETAGAMNAPRLDLRLHIRCLSSHKSYPGIAFSILRHDIEAPLRDALIQIADDVVAVFFTAGTQNLSGTQRLIICNWKTGRVCVDIDEWDMPSGLHDFSFVSSRSYIIPCTAHDGSIELYHFDADGPHLDGQEYPVRSDHVASFRLPDVQDEVQMTHFDTHTGPFEARCPPGKLFTTAPESRIHVFSLRYVRDEGRERTFCPYTMALHNQLLQSYVLAYTEAKEHMAKSDLAHESNFAVTAVQWEEWGPSNTFMWRQAVQFSWLRYVHGQRVAIPRIDGNPPHLIAEIHELQILDFNKYASRVHSEAYVSEDEKRDSPSFDHALVEDTKIKASLVFKSSFVCRLPHRKVLRRADCAYSGFMVDEERIVGLRKAAFSNEDMEDLHIYTF